MCFLLVLKKYSIPLFLVLLNFAVRILLVDSNDLSFDEIFSVFWANKAWGDLFSLFSYANNPPLYYVLLKAFIYFFDIEVYSVRFLSIVFSCISVLYLFKLSRFYGSVYQATLCCFCFIFSSLSLSYSITARAYALLLLLCILTFYFYLKFLKGLAIKDIIFFVLFGSLSIYSHFSAFIFLFALCLHFLMFGGVSYKGKAFLHFIVACLAILLIYSPYISILLSRIHDTNINGNWISRPSSVLVFVDMLWWFLNGSFGLVLYGSLFLLYIGLYWRSFLKDKIISLLFVLLFVHAFSFLFSVFFIPVYISRYLYFSIFLIHICFSFMLLKLLAPIKSKTPKSILLGLFGVLMIISCDFKQSNRLSIKHNVSEIRSLKNEESLVVLVPRSLKFEFSYYYDLSVFKDYNELENRLLKDDIISVNNYDEIKGLIKLTDYTNIIVYDRRLIDNKKESQLLSNLQNTFPHMSTTSKNSVFVLNK